MLHYQVSDTFLGKNFGPAIGMRRKQSARTVTNIALP
jgi:hypothetical protein